MSPFSDLCEEDGFSSKARFEDLLSSLAGEAVAARRFLQTLTDAFVPGLTRILREREAALVKEKDEGKRREIEWREREIEWRAKESDWLEKAKEFENHLDEKVDRWRKAVEALKKAVQEANEKLDEERKARRECHLLSVGRYRRAGSDERDAFRVGSRKEENANLERIFERVFRDVRRN